jgi:lyso-ornithine lipid O-acyltransferase
LSRARALLRLTVFAGMTLPLMPVQQLFVWTSPRLARVFPHKYHRAVCRVLGIEVKVKGEPVRDRACLLACNHVSWMDIPVLSSALPVSFIAKREVAKWPFFGTLARLQRTVFIDRDRRHATGAARDEIGERLQRGDQLVLFAEGTSSNGQRVRQFRSAFFGAAEAPGVIVQPVTLVYADAWGLPMTRRQRPSYAWYGGMDLAPHLWGAIARGPVTVEVTFHPPLQVSGNGGRKTVALQAEQTVRQHLLTRLARGRAG